MDNIYVHVCTTSSIDASGKWMFIHILVWVVYSYLIARALCCGYVGVKFTRAANKRHKARPGDSTVLIKMSEISPKVDFSSHWVVFHIVRRVSEICMQ